MIGRILWTEAAAGTCAVRPTWDCGTGLRPALGSAPSWGWPGRRSALVRAGEPVVDVSAEAAGCGLTGDAIDVSAEAAGCGLPRGAVAVSAPEANVGPEPTDADRTRRDLGGDQPRNLGA